jgi:hypothetical protein
MKTLGEYQNNIGDLEHLGLGRYERIFKVFDVDVDNKTFYLYNILRKVAFPTNIDSQFLDTYTTASSLPLTIVSYNIYTDISLWWLIYLINKSVIGTNIFTVPGNTELKYIKPAFLETIFTEITKNTIYNGRHF